MYSIYTFNKLDDKVCIMGQGGKGVWVGGWSVLLVARYETLVGGWRRLGDGRDWCTAGRVGRG